MFRPRFAIYNIPLKNGMIYIDNYGVLGGFGTKQDERQKIKIKKNKNNIKTNKLI